MTLDLKRFNFSEWFGCIDATNTKEMKSNAFKGLRTYIQEKSFEKWCDGQVSYVGDYMDGVDFLSTSNETRYEMKGRLGLISKKGCMAKIELKNFRKNKILKEDLKQTFDEIFLVDTKNMILAKSDWETVYKRTECNDATATFKLLPGDFEVIFQCTELSEKSISSSDILDSLQRIL
jgi:hypothetical protein